MRCTREQVRHPLINIIAHSSDFTFTFHFVLIIWTIGICAVCWTRRHNVKVEKYLVNIWLNWFFHWKPVNLFRWIILTCTIFHHPTHAYVNTCTTKKVLFYLRSIYGKNSLMNLIACRYFDQMFQLQESAVIIRCVLWKWALRVILKGQRKQS